MTFLVGAMRTGFIIFPISTRNSTPAIAFLLSETNSTHLFVSSESRSQTLTSDALAELPVGPTVVIQHAMPVFEDLYPIVGVDPDFIMAPARETSNSDVVLIIHSSGTCLLQIPSVLEN